jgi:F-type H+-transporting ATPase subunit b
MLIQLVIIQLVTLLAIVGLLRLVFRKHINSAVQRLNALHEENLIKEAQLKEELQRAKQERDAEVEKGREIAKELIEKAKKEILSLRAQAEEQAKQQAQKLITQGKYELEKTRQELLSEVQEHALELATRMVEYAFTTSGKQDLQHQLIKEIISEISKLGREKFPISGKKVKIKTSYPLSAQEKEWLQKIFSEKLGTEVRLEEQILPELITGLVVEIGALVIDGSLKNRLRRVIPYLKKTV